MTADELAAVGAFLSGAASVLAAWWALRAIRRQEKQVCDERIQALKEGIELGRRDNDKT